MICINMNESIKENINEIMNESTESIDETINKNPNVWLIKQAVTFIILKIVSLLFLLMTFMVYSILPELRNIHGYMLRRYVGSLFVGVIFYLVNPHIKIQNIENSACFVIAIVTYFFLLSRYFWLNVISFDMWQTFRKFRPLQGNVKQQERKKIVLYSIYAWGSPIILVVVCCIMEFFPKMPKDLIRPRFDFCWFSANWKSLTANSNNENMAIILYWYVPISINIISSICLSIYTILKIKRSEKESAHHLRDMDSRRHNDNKQWFNLYLKLFIVMFITLGINWTLVIVSSMSHKVLLYVFYPIKVTDFMHNLCIFIIFVWKKKIKQLLLKRFGCQNCFAFPKTQQATITASSNTCITTLEEIPVQDRMNFCGQANCREDGSFVSTRL